MKTSFSHKKTKFLIRKAISWLILSSGLLQTAFDENLRETTNTINIGSSDIAVVIQCNSM